MVSNTQDTVTYELADVGSRLLAIIVDGIVLSIIGRYFLRSQSAGYRWRHRRFSGWCSVQLVLLDTEQRADTGQDADEHPGSQSRWHTDARRRRSCPVHRLLHQQHLFRPGLDMGVV